MTCASANPSISPARWAATRPPAAPRPSASWTWPPSTAPRLCREREMLWHRAIDSDESAPTCLAFLGKGQEYYFYELHAFSSREGERVYGPGKAANGAKVRETTAALL